MERAAETASQTRKTVRDVFTSKQQSSVHLFEDVPDAFKFSDRAVKLTE
jgi:hypothetical protein